MLSLTESKILYELGRNARLTYKELARNINSKPSIVHYHTQKLIDDGFIQKFVPVFSIHALGLQGYKMYLKVHGLNAQQRAQLINDLVSRDDVSWVAETAGAWDLMWSSLTSNVLLFAEIKDAILQQWGGYIHEYAITVLQDGLVFNRDYLLDKNTAYRDEFIFGGLPEKIELDNAQKSIIQCIKNDGRYQITEVAHKLDLNVRTVRTKIQELEKQGILQGFTCFVDIEKLGLQFFKLCVYLQDHDVEEFEKLLSASKACPNVIHIIRSLGSWELELELEAKSVDDIYSIIQDFKSEFHGVIKDIDLVIIKREPKLDFIPTEF